MFEQILQLVKEHVSSNPEIAASIPAEHADAVHHEIATQIHETMQNQNQEPAPSAMGGGLADMAGGIFSQIKDSLASGNIATSAAAGGIVGALASKFGLNSAVTGAIAAAIPGLLQKLVHKEDTPATPAV
jgi:hypothetical protein